MNYFQFLKLAKIVNNNDNVNKVILASLLKKDLVWIYSNLDIINNDKELLNNYLNLVKKYALGMPLGYILGYVYFNNNKIFVNQNVLIPRNETELLVNRSLFFVAKLFNNSQIKVLDLATGSGCIAISLAKKNPNWKIIASDISNLALKTAKFNQEYHKINNITFIKSDLFDNLSNQQFDFIISNPPYIDENSKDYQIKNLKFEPRVALFADNFGLVYYQKILNLILTFTKKTFFIALEIGFDQKPSLELLLKNNFKQYYYWFEKDYNQQWRFLFISSKKL